MNAHVYPAHNIWIQDPQEGAFNNFSMITIQSNEMKVVYG